MAALEARGGTEMVPPMKAALTDRRDGDANPVRQVVFLTDGEIGNEQQLLDTIAAMRGRSRVFMVGIGSAPNSFLMTRAAEIGRGTFTHIGSVEQVDERMRVLFEKLESPAVTNLTATFSGTQADVTPAVIPDLYRGEPVVLAARLASLAGTLEIQGRIGERAWVVTCRSRAPRGQGPIQAVGAPQDRRRRSRADAATITPDEADKRILALALDHHLSARLTSLVAVDKTPSRPEGAPLTAPSCRSTCRPAGSSTRYSAASARPPRAGRRAAPPCTQSAMALAAGRRPRPRPRQGHSRGGPDRRAAAEDRDRRGAAPDVRSASAARACSCW